MSSNVFSASLCLQSFCLSVGEEEGWWVVVCCPQYVVMEDLVIQKECPPGQTGTIIDLFGIRRLHSLECWSGCRWIHRVGLCSHCSWQHTQVCSFLFVVGRFYLSLLSVNHKSCRVYGSDRTWWGVSIYENNRSDGKTSGFQNEQ